MSESQTHTSGNSESGPTNPSGSLAGTPTDTPDTDPTPVTSAAEQETADAARLDKAVNGEDAADHAADGQPTEADKQSKR